MQAKEAERALFLELARRARAGAAGFAQSESEFLISYLDRHDTWAVLLTRARQGMAIFVPPGDPRDPTRLPGFYDGTFEYLSGLGLPIA